MKKDDIVTIFNDPITEEVPMGKAKLLCLINGCGYVEGDKLEMWEVRYLGDNDGDETYQRLIRLHNH